MPLDFLNGLRKFQQILNLVLHDFTITYNSLALRATVATPQLELMERSRVLVLIDIPKRALLDMSVSIGVRADRYGFETGRF